MRRLRSSKSQYSFLLGRRELDLLRSILRLYPRIPPAHQVISKQGRLPDTQACQQLLDEALAEQRAENRRQLKSLFEGPARLRETKTGWRLSLAPAEMEFLLGVLNDIRVGSWVILGAPEEGIQKLDAQDLPHYWAMETAGYFQVQLLAALEAGLPPAKRPSR